VRPLPEILSRDEIKRFLDAADPQYRLMILCLYQTGMRWDEVRNLKWEDIDWHEGGIMVQKAKHWNSRIFPIMFRPKKKSFPIPGHCEDFI
jgi:integrase